MQNVLLQFNFPHKGTEILRGTTFPLKELMKTWKSTYLNKNKKIPTSYFNYFHLWELELEVFELCINNRTDCYLEENMYIHRLVAAVGQAELKKTHSAVFLCVL